MYDGSIWQFYLAGDIGRFLSYSLALDYSIFPGLPEQLYDKEYMLGNFDLILNFSNKITLTQGFRFDSTNKYELVNNEWIYRTLYTGFFANLRWQALDKLEVFAGYKTAENEIDAQMKTELDTFFLKFRYLY